MHFADELLLAGLSVNCCKPESNLDGVQDQLLRD